MTLEQIAAAVESLAAECRALRRDIDTARNRRFQRFYLTRLATFSADGNRPGMSAFEDGNGL